MKTTKSFLAVAAGLLPLLYIGGLLFYFSRFSSATGGLFDRQLGPTQFGLAGIGLLFVVLFALRLWRLSRGGDAAGPSGARTAGLADEDVKSDFDADAAFARAMARRSGEPGAPPPTFGSSTAPRPAGSFGRKGA
jgi:hypothetical protein